MKHSLFGLVSSAKHQKLCLPKKFLRPLHNLTAKAPTNNERRALDPAGHGPRGAVGVDHSGLGIRVPLGVLQHTRAPGFCQAERPCSREKRRARPFTIQHIHLSCGSIQGLATFRGRARARKRPNHGPGAPFTIQPIHLSACGSLQGLATFRDRARGRRRRVAHRGRFRAKPTRGRKPSAGGHEER